MGSGEGDSDSCPAPKLPPGVVNAGVSLPEGLPVLHTLAVALILVPVLSIS